MSLEDFSRRVVAQEPGRPSGEQIQRPHWISPVPGHSLTPRGVPLPPFAALPLAGRPASRDDERLPPWKSVGAGQRPDIATGHTGSAGTGAISLEPEATMVDNMC
jgi:hypothetical protein